jgi:hypothetical protein
MDLNMWVSHGWIRDCSRICRCESTRLVGTVIANAAIVPTGTSGSVDVYASQNTNLIIDINGYYAHQSGSRWRKARLVPPSLSFSGDAGRGILSAGAGNLNIATEGQTVLRSRMAM